MTIQEIDQSIVPEPFEAEHFVSLPDQVRAHARMQGDLVALREGDTALTWAQLSDAMDDMAGQLISMGYAPGDVVAVIGDPQSEYMIVFLAILAAGCCIAPLPLMASDDALAKMIEDSGARCLVIAKAQADRVGILLDAKHALSRVDRLALDFVSDDPSIRSLQGAPARRAMPLPAGDPDALFNIIYSSGTTGTPKGILHDNRYRYRQIERMRVTGLDSTKIMLVSTAMYSNTTLTAALAAMGCGATLIMMRKFSTSAYLKICQDQEPTHTILVPIQIQRLLADPAFSPDAINTLERTIVTSSPFSLVVKQKTLACWPGRILEMYGLTEGGVTTTLDTKRHANKLGSVGLPTKGATVRIIDADLKDVETGEVGEIIGRSPTMMRGYHNSPEQTAAATVRLPDGKLYIRSGDLGRLDEDGFLFLAGRAKDVIISGGFNIYASDLEDALLSHPAVKEASVVGLPSEDWGETPAAGVVLHEGQTVSPEVLMAYANVRLGKMQRIKDLRVLEILPLNAIGKVLRNLLVQELLDQKATETAAPD